MYNNIIFTILINQYLKQHDNTIILIISDGTSKNKIDGMRSYLTLKRLLKEKKCSSKE